MSETETLSQADADTAPVITVALTVVPAISNDIPKGFLSNRTGDYHYKFNPDSVHVVQCGTVITYQLTDCDTTRFTMADLYGTDFRTELSPPTISSCGSQISVTHRNKRKGLITVFVNVIDRESGIVQCDPQMTNDPPPGGF